MDQKYQKKRDILLALLSVGGIFYMVEKSYWGIIYIITDFSVGLEVMKFLIFFESVLLLIEGLFIWKIIKLSKDYSKYFILFFVIVFIIDLAHKLVVVHLLSSPI